MVNAETVRAILCILSLFDQEMQPYGVTSDAVLPVTFELTDRWM
jgi:hypothetical protein